RLAGSDLFVRLYLLAASSGLRIALIGGNPGSADAAAQQLQIRGGWEGDVVRTLCPPFGFERDHAQMQAISELLSTWKPHVVFVGLGSPKQEKLIEAIRPVLPSAWFLGVGVSFSFVAGEVQRAPAWMQRSGLEWFHRMVQEPGRLARRYLVDGIPFALGLMWRAWRNRRLPKTSS
ncbi:MAG: glycosyltransferase, partial [Alphaproteobacteria bacterium]